MLGAVFKRLHISIIRTVYRSIERPAWRVWVWRCISLGVLGVQGGICPVKCLDLLPSLVEPGLKVLNSPVFPLPVGALRRTVLGSPALEIPELSWVASWETGSVDLQRGQMERHPCSGSFGFFWWEPWQWKDHPLPGRDKC